MRDTAEAILDEDLSFEEIADPVVDVDDEEDTAAEEPEAGANESWSDTSRDLVAAFFAEVSQVDLLTREEEERLGGEIARRRARVLRVLRGRKRLVTEALEDVGRGVVHPDEDFREREALTVLTFAQRKLRAMRRNERGRKVLGTFITDLERELAGYRELRDRMMTANVRLVMTLARRYRHPTLSYLDLVQEGVLGLMRAVEKYEPSRGIKFSTYAVWWIWQQISRAADCQGAMIRTPVHWNQFRRKLGRSTVPAERSRDAQSLAEEHGMSQERLAAMSQQFQCLSLASPLGSEDDRTLGDTLAADDGADPECAVLESDLNGRLTGAVGELPDREAKILRLRFGLDGGRSYTLEEIGEQFGVSRERIRQLEARALKRMRAICDQQGLTDILH